jgi:hypothetical protein
LAAGWIPPGFDGIIADIGATPGFSRFEKTPPSNNHEPIMVCGSARSCYLKDGDVSIIL